MTQPQVGAWVQTRRKTLKLGVKRACELAGISRTAWYDLEADRHPPGLDTQARIATALSVRRDWYDRLLAGRKPIEVTPGPASELDEILFRLDELERLQSEMGTELRGLSEDQKELASWAHRHAGRRHGEVIAFGQ